MNIFILDLNVTRNAQMHCDKHVSKMILETAQIMCSALTLARVSHNGYKPTHIHHPCVTWARNLRHFLYLRDLGRALSKEYTHRYGREHKSLAVINGLPIPEMTVVRPKYFALAMPTEYHMYTKHGDQYDIDPVKSYRAYYKSKQDKFDMRWTNRDVPKWFN